MNAPETLDQEFLVARAKILEIAAILDRLDRYDGDVNNDPRMKLLGQGLSILQETNRDTRAEEIQLTFSRSYEDNWKQTFGV